MPTLQACFSAVPVVAILRGVRPNEVISIGRALIDAGIRVIEVPLNSPDPLHSIRTLALEFSHDAAIGAGTVLSLEQLDAVIKAGGRIAVAPNTDEKIIRAACDAGVEPMPGIFSPTEAFVALAAGANYLKLFPASVVGPAGLRAMRAVLPADARVLAVGGVGAETIDAWRLAGANGFGIGSEIYRPGDEPASVARRARDLVEVIKKSGR